MIFSSRPFINYFLPALISVTVVVIFLWMQGQVLSAIILDLVALNIMLFLISEEMPVMAGFDLYYVAIGSAALVLFGYEFWRAGICFSLLSMLLFLISRFSSFEMIPLKHFSLREEEIFFAINSISAAFIGVYSVITIMKLNFKAQKNLEQIKTKIENQNFELKKANEELDRFVYSASHDLKSPLSSIKGLVNVFEMDQNAKKEEYLPKINARIRAMDKFIEDITNYSRNSRAQVSFELLLIYPLVQDVISALQYIEEAEKIDFKIEIETDFVVKSDAYRVKVILTNLISNAIKYADRSKENPFILIKAFKENKRSFIQIIDNGIGIRSELHTKIFDMFYRATEASIGTGLGLYIVSESIKKINAEIKIDSALGKGSTFTLILP